MALRHYYIPASGYEKSELKDKITSIQFNQLVLEKNMGLVQVSVELHGKIVAVFSIPLAELKEAYSWLHKASYLK